MSYFSDSDKFKKKMSREFDEMSEHSGKSYKLFNILVAAIAICTCIKKCNENKLDNLVQPNKHTFTYPK